MRTSMAVIVILTISKFRVHSAGNNLSVTASKDDINKPNKQNVGVQRSASRSKQVRETITRRLTCNVSELTSDMGAPNAKVAAVRPEVPPKPSRLRSKFARKPSAAGTAAPLTAAVPNKNNGRNVSKTTAGKTTLFSVKQKPPIPAKKEAPKSESPNLRERRLTKRGTAKNIGPLLRIETNPKPYQASRAPAPTRAPSIRERTQRPKTSAVVGHFRPPTFKINRHYSDHGRQATNKKNPDNTVVVHYGMKLNPITPNTPFFRGGRRTYIDTVIESHDEIRPLMSSEISEDGEANEYSPTYSPRLPLHHDDAKDGITHSWPPKKLLTKKEALPDDFWKTYTWPSEIGEYVLGEEFGGGQSLTVVIMAHLKRDERIKCVLKTGLCSNRLALNLLLQEYDMLSEVTPARNIVTLYHSFYFADENGNECYCMVLEYIDGYNLYDMTLGSGIRLEEARAKRLAKDLVRGLGTLRAKHVMHADIKHQNLVVRQKPDDSMELVIIDFGFAEKLGSHGIGAKSVSVCGTMEYIAPEIFLKEGHDYAVDNWALGVVLYGMLIGDLPYNMDWYNDNNDVQVVINFFKRLDFRILDASGISESAKVMIKELLVFNPEDRLGSRNFAEIENHEWLTTD